MRSRRSVALGLLGLLFLSQCASLWAQKSSDPYWMLLERGKKLFDDKLYGDALLVFEDAQKARGAYYQSLYDELVKVLSLEDFRRLGDSLDAVENLAAQKGLTRVVEALNVASASSRSALGGSASAALGVLKGLKDYPEAEYWIGEVFRFEGETTLALGQYRDAWAHRANLDVPDDGVTILYRQADILLDKGAYAEREEVLLKIVSLDPVWTGRDGVYARSAMERTLRNDGIDEFLRLYRSGHSLAYAAYRDLGLYYYRTGRHDRATTQLMLAVLVSSSVVLDELSRTADSFAYAGLEDALDRSSGRWRIQEYLASADYYKTLYYLGASLFAQGQRRSADGLWRVVASRKDAGEWGGRARIQLKSPTVETPTERP